MDVPIFFQVELDSRLHDALISTKKGNLRLLMVTATDGDGSLTSSVKELMVDVEMRVTLDDLCLVMQAASMCLFLPQKLHTALDRRQIQIQIQIVYLTQTCIFLRHKKITLIIICLYTYMSWRSSKGYVAASARPPIFKYSFNN